MRVHRALKAGGVMLISGSLLAIAGCNGFFTDRATVRGTGGTTGGASRFAYVSNFNNGSSGSISTYVMSTTTGALTPAGTVTPRVDVTSAGPASIVTSNSGAFLYLANDGGGVSAFTVNATSGALTEISGSPFVTGLATPTHEAVDPSSKFLFVADSSGTGIAAFSINSSTGVLTAVTGSPFTTGSVPVVGITVHPNGNFLYLAMEGVGVGRFTINASSGALSAIQIIPPSPGGQEQSVAINPAGTFAFVANGFSGIDIFSITQSTGALTRVGTAAFQTGNNPIEVVTDLSGRLLYAVNRDDVVAANNFVSAMSIQSDGTLKLLTNGVANVGNPSSLALDPSGKFVYVTDFNTAGVSVFSMNSDGTLSSVGTVATGTNPSGVAFR